MFALIQNPLKQFSSIDRIIEDISDYKISFMIILEVIPISLIHFSIFLGLAFKILIFFKWSDNFVVNYRFLFNFISFTLNLALSKTTMLVILNH